MVRAKNYETVSTFVEVIQKKLWPLFFRTQCIYSHLQGNPNSSNLCLQLKVAY